MKKVLVLVILVLFSIILIGCGDEIFNPACARRDYVQAVICTEEYKPVCSPDGIVYNNKCKAYVDGWAAEKIREKQSHFLLANTGRC